MTSEGGQEVDDMDVLEAEFPSWTFAAQWHAVPSGPDVRTLTAWRDGVTLLAHSAAALRRKVREAGG